MEVPEVKEKILRCRKAYLLLQMGIWNNYEKHTEIIVFDWNKILAKSPRLKVLGFAPIQNSIKAALKRAMAAEGAVNQGIK
ncbi:hypothetical protein EK904_010418, partial [Melospiza melodia maxima]